MCSSLNCRLHQILNRKQSPISIWMIFFDVTGNITQPQKTMLCLRSNPNPFTIVLSCYEPIGSNYDSTDRHYNFSIRRARCLHLMSHQTEKYKIMLRMFPPEKMSGENWESTMMSYHTSATTAATCSLGTIKNCGGGWWNRWSIPFSYCTIYPSS
jgi:hypothetical protein